MVDPIKLEDAMEQMEVLLQAGDIDAATEYLRALHPADGAEMLATLEPEDQAAIIARMEPDELADVFEQMDEDDAAEVAQHLGVGAIADVLDEMEPDMAADLLGGLEPADASAVLEQMDEAKSVTPLLAYEEDSAGGIMTIAPPSLRRYMTVAEAFQFIKEHYRDANQIFYLYVLDRNGQLIGVVNLRALILAEPTQTVEEIMQREVITVHDDMDQEKVAQIFAHYDLLALPVVDHEDRLVGLVTVDDVVDVLEEEATEDSQKVGGLEALDMPYLAISIVTLVQKRARWLIALFLGEMLTATAMGYYEHEIASAVVLALFVPLIISSGGNSGSQAASLIIRALAVREVGLRDWWRVMRREIFSGLALGVILGGIGFFRVTIWQQFFGMYGEHWLLVAFTVGISLIGVVLWGTLSGSMLPFVMQRLGIDPATSSAPFVATLVDVTGLIIYFTVATFLLRGTLL